MSTIKAIAKGIGVACRKPKLLAYLWTANILFALIMAAPLLFLVRKELEHSLFGRTVQGFNVLWLGEMIHRYQNTLPALSAGLLIPVLVFFLLSVFLNGGTIGRLVDTQGDASLKSFFEDCGRYVLRFFRVLLLALPFFILVFGGVLRLLSILFRPLRDNAVTEWTEIILSNLHLAISLLLLAFLQMFFDYVKIHIVTEDEKKVLRAAARAWTFVKKRIFRAWFLYLLIAGLGLAGTVLFVRVTGLVPSSGLFGLAAGLVWGQLYLVFRMWIKLLFFSSQSQYYSANRF